MNGKSSEDEKPETGEEKKKEGKKEEVDVDEVERKVEEDLAEPVEGQPEQGVKEEFKEVEETVGQTRAKIGEKKLCPYCSHPLVHVPKPNAYDADYICQNCEKGFKEEE